MPLTASSPIEPPGNRIGRTTKASVVSASRACPDGEQARVGQLLERRVGQQRHDETLDQRPARLAARAVRHRDPLVAEPLRPPAHRLDAFADLVLA